MIKQPIRENSLTAGCRLLGGGGGGGTWCNLTRLQIISNPLSERVLCNHSIKITRTASIQRQMPLRKRIDSKYNTNNSGSVCLFRQTPARAHADHAIMIDTIDIVRTSSIADGNLLTDLLDTRGVSGSNVYSELYRLSSFASLVKFYVFWRYSFKFRRVII